MCWTSISNILLFFRSSVFMLLTLLALSVTMLKQLYWVLHFVIVWVALFTKYLVMCECPEVSIDFMRYFLPGLVAITQMIGSLIMLVQPYKLLHTAWPFKILKQLSNSSLKISSRSTPPTCFLFGGVKPDLNAAFRILHVFKNKLENSKILI